MIYKAVLIVCLLSSDHIGIARCGGQVAETPLPTAEACVRQTVAMQQVTQLSLPVGRYLFARKCIPIPRPSRD